MWPSSGAPNSPDADVAPSAERHDLTHTGTCAERGKPVALPKWQDLLWESKPQGEPTGLRVWDSGKSECSTVMVEIGVAARRAISLHAKAGRLARGTQSRERWRECKQEDPLIKKWDGGQVRTTWRKYLLARPCILLSMNTMVTGYREGQAFRSETGSRETGLMECLSRMR